MISWFIFTGEEWGEILLRPRNKYGKGKREKLHSNGEHDKGEIKKNIEIELQIETQWTECWLMCQ